MKFSAIVPIKRNSSRVPNKNFRFFCGKPLYTYILTTLSSCEAIDEIIVNTDSEELIQILPYQFPKCVCVARPDYLQEETITMNTLLEHDLKLARNEHVIQTHVTNPLLTLHTLQRCLVEYESNLDKYDSLFTVDAVRTRVYSSDGKPINHELGKMLQTQDLKPVLKENSNLFLFSKQSYSLSGNNRVGQSPYMFPMNSIESLDIDYEDDFILAELVYHHKHLFTNIF